MIISHLEYVLLDLFHIPASVGGLMGLFMGFSFISIAEFIYYAILRPYHKIKRHERVNHTPPRNQPSRNYQVRFVSPSSKPLHYIPEHLMNSTKLQLFPPQSEGVRRQSDQDSLFIKGQPWTKETPRIFK